ncbi:MAG: hypothetical protein RMJ59_06195 [Candidatus Nitrosocaldus sp.]|nr:hypothetical protein [Candidatus Nitrosocaldus sp.]MCS7141079.1 hypothetical protein [Candidatus Nitrosocaldus sp.]MDW8000043.1 hypothetical protein [Candidatus Nitrosocaldus sp.]MDW8275952.1 hypothetical protein [Candidatus Nitrosocaldus sp.]
MQEGSSQSVSLRHARAITTLTRSFFPNFKSVSLRADGTIIKLDEIFMNATANRLLVRAVVVEGPSQGHSTWMSC